jgi:DNA-directed RNA polymerase alpha subunit
MDASIEMQRVQEQVAKVKVENHPILPRVKKRDRIDVFRFSLRTHNLLLNADIWTVRELISKRPTEIIKLRNCGYARLLEIQTELAARGYKLKKEKA